MEEELIDLVKKMKSGQMNVFESFYDLTKKTIFYNILQITQNEMASEDILQEVYIKFLDNLKKIKENTNPMGFLMKVSRNMALDYYRKYSRELYFDQYDNEEVYGFTEDKVDYSDHLIRDMKKILNETELQVVLMHVLQDMTHKEIASALNKPLGTITWMYNQAIKKLREGLNYDIS